MTSAFGEKYRFVASVKSDAYYVNKYEYKQNNRYNGATGRVFPQAGVEWRLPFVRATDDSRQIIEPVVVGVLAPEGGNKANKIPNEDSEDVYFDDTNVLDLDRYAGYDRNDTGSRVSYGMRWSSYGDIFGRTSAFLAQTYEYNKQTYPSTAWD
jgi:LPS-assembly protein